MRDKRPSKTAAWVAAARGLGRLLPEDIRIADDPYGTAFASDYLAKAPRALARLPGMRSWILYMQVRTKVLDDAVRAFVIMGGRQLVILGAGYDCRALRLPELDGSTVFEVDHPATQAHKQRVLDRMGAESPSKYLAWDFEKNPMAELGAALAKLGHDPKRPTLTIWEGVTMYLTEGAIDASLRAIRSWSSPGSQLAMTYFARSRIESPSLSTRAIQAVVSRVGEPWRWGWDPDQLPDYVATRGFAVEQDIAMGAAARELLPASDARLVGHDDRRVAIVGASAEAIANVT